MSIHPFDSRTWLNSMFIGIRESIGTIFPMWSLCSSLYDNYARRVVVPLVRKSALKKINSPRFNPPFKIANVQVVLHPLEIVSVPNEQLGEFVESLAREGIRIIDALDELLTQAWG